MIETTPSLSSSDRLKSRRFCLKEDLIIYTDDKRSDEGLRDIHNHIWQLITSNIFFVLSFFNIFKEKINSDWIYL